MAENFSSLEQKINSIIQELSTLISQNSKDNVRIDALLKSLLAIGSWHIIDPIKTILKNPNCSTQIQQKCLELLGKIQDPRVVSILASYLEQENTKLRNTAIKSISLIKHPKVSSYLIPITKEEDKWIKIFAIHGLTKNSSPKVVQPLIHLLGDQEEEVRKEAINALTRLKTENIDDLLINAINSENRYIKFGAVNLLGARKVSKSVPSLVPLIGIEDLRLNLIVCKTLSILSSSKTLIPLLDNSIKTGITSNRYLLCMQKMDETIIPSLIKIYLNDQTGTYSNHIEVLLAKFGLAAHEFIVNLKATEKNSNYFKKLDELEKQIEI